MRAPHTRPPSPALGEPVAAPEDPRLRNRLVSWAGQAFDVVLLGVPSDEGVRLNGGRPGAAEGPEAFRRALLRFGTTYDLELGVDFDHLVLADAGDLEVLPGDLGATHARLRESLTCLLSYDGTIVLVGGGNDQSFAAAAALQERFGGIGVVNIDAHLDVRPVVEGRVHSGTPYRRIVEELGVPGERVVEIGLHPHVNARAHHEWALGAGMRCISLARLRQQGPGPLLVAELDRLATAAEALMVSFDLDVFSAAHAPGVSAPGTVGLTPEEGRALALAAGRHPQVKVFELVELCPRHDLDQRTARLAASLFTTFLAGLAGR